VRATESFIFRWATEQGSVQDLYTPEITNNNGFDNTVSVVCTVANDELKVKAVVNEIRGFAE
jgi:hypothetical protein